MKFLTRRQLRRTVRAVEGRAGRPLTQLERQRVETAHAQARQGQLQARMALAHLIDGRTAGWPQDRLNDALARHGLERIP